VQPLKIHVLGFLSRCGGVEVRCRSGVCAQCSLASLVALRDSSGTAATELNFSSFRFLMKTLWALEVGLFHISMHLVQSDL